MTGMPSLETCLATKARLLRATRAHPPAGYLLTIHRAHSAPCFGMLVISSRWFLDMQMQTLVSGVDRIRHLGIVVVTNLLNELIYKNLDIYIFIQG